MVKKAYQELVSFLEDNKDCIVDDLLDDIKAMCSSQRGAGATFYRDEAGEVLGIRCAYYGLWFNPNEVDFGYKNSSASGYSNMTKEGANHAARQAREAQKAKNNALLEVANGTLDIADLPAALAEIEEEENKVEETDLVGYDTLEDLLASSE